jgi:hypothetical protein
MNVQTSRYLTISVGAVAALATCTALSGAQRTGVLSTVVLVGDAEPQTPEPRLYRVYEAPKQFVLRLTLGNESSESVFVDHLSMIGLGDASLRLNRYAEATIELENAWRVMRRHRSGVPIRLALAYVGVGDEVNAARVLREDGVSEPRIPSRLDRFRSVIRPRK